MSIRIPLVALVLALTAAARAEEVRFYEENGMTFRESRHRVQRPLWETRVEEREQTVYREQYSSEVREEDRVVHTPVTEYVWQPVVRDRWNPFVQPSVQFQLVPQTRWESRVERVRTPVARRELVPEKRVERVPVTAMRVVEEEIISRVAVGPAASGSAASIAVRERVGGEKLEGDPPRKPSSWSASDGAARR
jgi:hypothetical protein